MFNFRFLALTLLVLSAVVTQITADSLTPTSATRSVYAESTENLIDYSTDTAVPASQFAGFDATAVADNFWEASQVSTIRDRRVFGDLDATGFFDPPVEDGFAESDFLLEFDIDETTGFTLRGNVGGLSGRGLIRLTGPGGVIFEENSNSDGIEDPYITVTFDEHGELLAGSYELIANARTSFGASFAGGDVRFELLIPEPASGVMVLAALGAMMPRRGRQRS